MTKQALTLCYIDDNKEIQPFPSATLPARLDSYTYSAKRMGNAPTIQGTLNYPKCLDEYWSDRSSFAKYYNVFVEYQGEKYYIDQTPTSSKDNTSVVYKHELSFVSERIILEHTLFLDVVTTSTPEIYKDRARSNETKFQFYGNLEELAARINDSLVYTGTGYTLSISAELEKDLKEKKKWDDTYEISFDAQTHYEVLNQMAETFDVGYYFHTDKETGKKQIFVGNYEAHLAPVEYGSKGGLLSVTKTNSNEAIVDRITGVGGDKNVPYYYPNPTPYGTLDFVTDFGNYWIQGIQKTKLERCFRSWQGIELTYYNDRYGLGPDRLSRKEYDLSVPPGGWVRSTNTDYPWESSWSINSLFAFHGFGHETYGFRFSLQFMDKEGNYIPKPKGFYYKLSGKLHTPDGTTIVWDHIKEYNSYDYLYRFSLNGDVHFDIQFDRTLEKHWEDPALFDSEVKYYILSVEMESQSASGNKRWGWYRGEDFFDYDKVGIIVRNKTAIPNGGWIKVNNITYVQPMSNIMPAIYLESHRNERFYNADKAPHYHSLSPQVDIDYKERYPDFDFNYPNPYRKAFPHEHKEDFEDIYPTIKDIENIDGFHIGEVADVMFDDNDDDTLKCETDENTESTEYNHPYFYMKIHRTAIIKNGKDHSFNLFDQLIENESMKICMTTGDCAGCEFEVKTWKPIESKETGALIFRNPIWTTGTGTDERPIDGDSDKKVVPYNSPEKISDSMQDTSQNEVWLVLSKEDSTFSRVMPNKSYNVKPRGPWVDSEGIEHPGDSFVITGITMPQAFIRDAEYRLEEELLKYMREHNEEIFNFSAHFSRIYIASNSKFFHDLNENSLVPVVYNGVTHNLYVTSYSCKADTNCLYDVSIELGEEIKARENAIAEMIKAAASRSANDASRKSSRAQLSAMTAAQVYTNTQINMIKSSVGITDDSGGGGSSGGGTGGEDNSLTDRINDLANGLDGLRDDINDINDAMDGLGDTFLHKDREDAAKEKITFEKGLAVGNGTYDFTATGDLSANDIYSYGTIYGENIEANGSVKTPALHSDTIDNSGDITTQNLTVTGAAHFFELIIDKARATNGMMVQSPANASIVKVEERLPDEYDLYFLAENDGDTITNDFMVGDQIFCQTFNIDQAQQRFYWVLCTDVSESPTGVTLNVGGEDVVKQCHRITVDFNQCASNCNAYPQMGDDVAVLGHQEVGIGVYADIDGDVYDIPEDAGDEVFIGEEKDGSYFFGGISYDGDTGISERCSATIISSVASGFLGLRQTEENSLGVRPLLQAPMFVQLRNIDSFSIKPERNNGNIISHDYNSLIGNFRVESDGGVLSLDEKIHMSSKDDLGAMGIDIESGKITIGKKHDEGVGTLTIDTDNFKLNEEGDVDISGDVTCKSLEYTQPDTYEFVHEKDEIADIDYYWIKIKNESFVVVPTNYKGKDSSTIRLPILEDGHTREIIVFKSFDGSLSADFNARLAPMSLPSGELTPDDSLEEGGENMEQESDKTDAGELVDKGEVNEFEDKGTFLPDNLVEQEFDVPTLSAFGEEIYNGELLAENAVIICRSNSTNWQVSQSVTLKGVGFKFLGYRPNGCATTYWTVHSYDSMVHNPNS